MTVTVTRSDPWFDVTKSPYNAKGNGVTDDTVAIQAAINACVTAGGGTVYVPGHGNVYLCNTETQNSHGGLRFIFYVNGDNVRFVMDDGATIKTTVGNANQTVLFSVSGALKPVGPSGDWTLHSIGKTNLAAHPVYDMSAALQGDNTVTLTTAGNAANFAAGDVIFVRTGQANGAAEDTEPDSEFNEVVASDAGTGIVTLKYPLSKDYAQEYFVSGTSGATTTTPTANLAKLGVQNATTCTLRNISFENMNVSDHPSSSKGCVFQIGQVLGLDIVDGTFDLGDAHLMNAGTYRFSNISRNKVRAVLSSQTTRQSFSCSFGTNDVHVIDNVVDGQGGVFFFHIAEGNTDILISGNTFRQTTFANAQQVISSGSRGYRVRIEGNRIHRQGAGADAVFMQTGMVGGTFIGNDVVGDVGLASPAIIRGNTVNNEFDIYNAGQQIAPYWLWGQINYNTSPILLGTVPLAFDASRAKIRVFTAFTDTGTDIITVGYSGATTAIVSTCDVSTTGIKAPTMGTNTWHNDNARDLYAYYVGQNGNAGAGKAIVGVEITPCVRNT